VANTPRWLAVIRRRATVIPKKVLNHVDDFRTELPDLFVGQKPV
jgi:hypothetical protein